MFCRFASTFVATEQVAAGIVPAVFGTMVMFTGFIIPPPSIPGWWIWIYYLSPFHYALEACMINELYDTGYHCTPNEREPPAYLPIANAPASLGGFEGNYVCPVTQGAQQLNHLGMHTQFYWRWIHLAIVLGFSLFFIGLTFIGASRVNHSANMVMLYVHPFFSLSNLLQARRSKKDADVKIDVMADKVSEAQKGRGAFMSWENLSYAVDVKKEGHNEKLTLLDGINGFVRPGMLMALMGPSGAGKVRNLFDKTKKTYF